MKPFFSLIILVALLINGCAESVEKTDRELPPSIYAKNEKFWIRPNLEEGARFEYYYAWEDEVVNGWVDRKMDTATTFLEFWFTAENLGKEGGAFKRKWEFLKFKGYRNAWNKVASDGPAYYPFPGNWQQQLQLSPPVIEMDEQGIVSDAKGFKYPFWTQLPDTNYSMDEWWKENLNLMSVFPNDSVHPGATWTNVFELRSNLPMVQEAVYELKEVNGNMAKITVEADIKPSRKPVPYEQKYDFVLSGTKQGYYLVDISTGLISDSRVIFDLTGTSYSRLPDTLLANDSARIKRTVIVKTGGLQKKKAEPEPAPVPANVVIPQPVQPNPQPPADKPANANPATPTPAPAKETPDSEGDL